MWRKTLIMEAQKAMTWGESSGECWGVVGAEDRRIKCADTEDHKVKGRTDYSSHRQPVG